MLCLQAAGVPGGLNIAPRRLALAGAPKAAPIPCPFRRVELAAYLALPLLPLRPMQVQRQVRPGVLPRFAAQLPLAVCVSAATGELQLPLRQSPGAYQP